MPDETNSTKVADSGKIADTAKVADTTKIAEEGKKKSAKNLSKEQIKGMSKYKAQQILNSKDPDLLKKIEEEVAIKAAQLKRKIMIAGFILAAGIVAGIVYMEMKKKEQKRPADKYSIVATDGHRVY